MPDIRFDRSAIARTSLFVGISTLVTVLARVRVRDLQSWTLDDLLFRVVLVAVGFAVLFVLGVKQLRQRHIRSSSAYAGLGVLANVPPFLLANGWGLVADAARDGVLSLVLCLPVLIGGVSGYLYHRSAGYEIDGDDVDALAASVEPFALGSTAGQVDGQPSARSQGVSSAPLFGTKAAAPAYVATGTAEYYDGPLQVRNSTGARIVAALCGAALQVFLQAMGMLGDNFHLPVREEFNNPALLVGMGILGGTVLFSAFIKLVTGMLRKFDKTSLGSFAVAGLLTPWVLGLPLGTGRLVHGTFRLRSLWFRDGGVPHPRGL
jgi:hypothetical protein